MFKTRPIPFVLMCLAFVFSFATGACAGPVDKAKEFMKARMFPQAIAVLEDEIKKKPTNAEAHFHLAVCYVEVGNQYGADERFRSAVAIKPDTYGNKVGNEYVKIGALNLNAGKFEESDRLFVKALQYQPKLKDAVADEYGKAGSLYLSRNQVTEAKRLYGSLLQFKPEMRSAVGDLFLKKGSEMFQWDGQKAEEIFTAAIAYDSSFREKVCSAYFEKWKDPKNDSDLRQLQKTTKYCSTYDNEIFAIMLNRIPGAGGISSLGLTQSDKNDIYRNLINNLPEEIVIIKLTSKQLETVRTVKAGQKWVYYYFDKKFCHLVGNATWCKPVDNNKPWNADAEGKLQVKTDEPPAVLVIGMNPRSVAGN